MVKTDIIMFMNDDDRKEFIRTTVYLSREMHESAKLMALFTRTNVSNLMRAALTDKIKKIKEDHKNS